ncbi:MAG: esterase family protein [Calditrichaeota bacterium]|nr:MAG: esterase family protein [Calditrichota bacterium]MBL1204810.1 esterase family protein [Calditrichota bacterium]NOG44639.1 esterase family protein [Calditrichota bacterium]
MNLRSKCALFSILFLLLIGFCQSATVDTVLVYSPKMEKEIFTVVVIPENGNVQKFPSVYLLHGYGGSHKDWSSHMDLKPLAEQYQCIIICPDGSKASWYLDSPEVKESQYETFVASELVTFIDSKYPTIKSKNKRVITGLSMGGHGALYLAIRHPDLFSAAGNMSGVVDLPNSSVKKELAVKLGSFEEYPERWKENSIVNMIEQIRSAKLAILIDCGVDDYFANDNRNLHKLLLDANIDHDYVERPGGHSWDYWTRVLKYHILFFNEHFENGEAK